MAGLIGWVAGALLLATTSVAAPPQPGVTVLVHGLMALGGVNSSPYEYWGGEKGENLTALLERFGSGLVWEYDPDTGNFSNITHAQNPDNTYCIPHTTNWFPAFAGHQILLFDWSRGSDDAESGQAEAAADALFAALMRFRVNGEPIISSSPYTALRPLHFVGHSRGTVVVSETVQRLGRYNIRVNYVTYLDIHDFGQPDIPSDQLFHDPAVQVWENVDYVDVAYQQNPATMCGVNPAGRPLEHLEHGPLQRNLTLQTALFSTDGCKAYDRPHAWIKDYYWGTVATNGPSLRRPANWYLDHGGDGTGRGLGFDRWLARGGFSQGADPAISRRRAVVGGDATPFVWGNDPTNDNGHPDRNDVPPVLFNGDFELPDLERGIGNTPANTLAGWRFLGGGGSAFVRPIHLPGTALPDNSYLELRDTSLEARHNRFFLPPEAREIRFALWVPFVPNTPLNDHVLELYIGNRVIRRYTVAETDGFLVRDADLTSHPDLLGGVNTLTFKLVTVPHAVTLRTAEVRLDNINIVVDPTSWFHAFYDLDGSNWRLIWRSWPAARIYLEATGDFGEWLPVGNSSTDSNAGSFTVPHGEEPRTYYRSRVVPAR